MPLTVHEPQQDERGQPRHRHGEQQDATATAPVHRGPQQQPGPAPRTDGQQVGPIEAGGVTSDVPAERAVAVTDAVGNEPERERGEERGERRERETETETETERETDRKR